MSSMVINFTKIDLCLPVAWFGEEEIKSGGQNRCLVDKTGTGTNVSVHRSGS